MVSELAMASSTSSISAPEFSPAKTHLPDISIKLASNNYLLWKAQVIPILRGHGLLGYVTNKITCPDSTIAGADGVLQPNPAAATWLRTDQLILGWINSSLSDGPLSQVINSESCHDAWTVLETLYGSHTRDRIQQMKGELQTLSKGSYSLEDYLHKAKSLALSLRGAGKPMDDDDLIVCILRGLGSEFDPIIAALNARDMFPSLEGVISKLRDFEIRIQNARTTLSSVAFYTNRNRSNTKTHGNFNMRDRRGGYSKMQFQGRNRDGYNARSGDSSSRTKLPSFTRTGRSSGRGRGVKDNAEDGWYPDTGANQHMTSDPNEVQGIDLYSGTDKVMVGNGNGLAIAGTGHTKLPTTNLKLNNVLIVPAIKKKLLHVKFNELHFPFKTDALSKSANTRLFQLQSIPKFLDHHALSQPQPRLPTNEESATEVTEYPSSEVHPEAMSPSRSSSSLQTHEVFVPEPATYQSSESQPTVVSSSPIEPINNLPSRAKPISTPIASAPAVSSSLSILSKDGEVPSVVQFLNSVLHVSVGEMEWGGGRVPARTVIPLFLLKETGECVRTRRQGRKRRNKHGGGGLGSTEQRKPEEKANRKQKEREENRPKPVLFPVFRLQQRLQIR
ncbi:hypothetical protein POTOM_010341 [Populus tomentosa]|uniref:Retrovirus-related Pol polyprotein from transposon TNT 1-94-like beta-barrel domain-containing protein n=1 Tax=Populus tomentosa TaxID=118781 RepID=A0A8X8A8B7_POPTO|nr:hypothetical protein POTOM_010341 [Populus tomentosa]